MSIQHHNEESSECDWQDAAWSFVLGAGGAQENEAFRAHLFEGCALCGAEIVEARSVIADLDVAVAQRTLARGHGSRPSPQVRARLMAEVDASQKHARHQHAPPAPQVAIGDALEPTRLAGISVAESSDEGWEATPFEGVAFRILSNNTEAKTSTALVRMAPGSTYPSHRHTVREECYVISGDLHFGGESMQAGDYQLAELNSIHPEQTTQGGCVLLIMASLEDELL